MWFRSLFGSPTSRPRARRRGQRRPQLETLEDRNLLTLNPAVNFAVGAMPVDIAVGDFSGDGVDDLATVSATHLSVLGGNGDGTFGAAQTTSVGTGLRALAAGYFNADSRLDLAITSSVTRLP